MRSILALVLAGSIAGFAAVSAANAAGEHDQPVPPRNKWSFSGPFGKFDRGQLQRGFKVYKEVCAVCHGLDLVAFRNLTGLGYSEVPRPDSLLRWGIGMRGGRKDAVI